MAIEPKTISEKADDVMNKGTAMVADAHEGLDAQLDALRNEIAAIGRAVQDMGEAGWETAGDMAHAMERQGRRAAEAVRDNPLPVVAGLATVALLAALVFRRH